MTSDFGLTFVNGDYETGERIHTYKDFGLIMTEHNIPKPNPIENKVSVPYKSGAIDLTDIAGDTPFSDRTGLSFSFKLKDGGRDKVEWIVTNIAKFIHGRKLIMLSDADKYFYYIVRLEVNYSKDSINWSNINITGTAEPYKYARFKSGENWLWNPFNFETGVITHLNDLVITDGATIPMDNDSIYTVPEFVVEESDGLALVFGGKTYSMPSANTYYFPQVRIGDETLNLTFVGSGKLSINFRGRYL